ncbi:uncharacterized protein SETTUDRAFT_176858 [Exserohilum turcica Et28A]|uniref:Uncharacterized protein n=1 Tax=Exserohilum turcicum (strain 28A) TaxID=671987 RepID=R0KJW6_EXST2|nr:uncharacterized protein SETTUDRAFT_176858 [Exserohilum turcica Et28A]EOA88302.1 hypothetical protein SETTUDRAFT_176858 [Exserohilum turcica Et28A]
MSDTSAMEHEKIEMGSNPGRDETPLSRQLTVNLTPEQYERLFFQPSAPRNGDFAKRFSNPTLLGLFGFLVPYTATCCILCGFRGALPPQSLVGLTGSFYSFGAWSWFILGNSFPMTIFIVYGAHYIALAYGQAPTSETLLAFQDLGGATGAAYNTSQGFYNVSMVLVSFMFLLGTFRVNACFILLFLGVTILFAFVAAANFNIAAHGTATDMAYVKTLLKAGGAFGLMSAVVGWYLVLVTVCEMAAIPCPLPVFDLSSRIFPPKPKPSKEE